MSNQFKSVEEECGPAGEEEECAMCGGTGGWPRLGEWEMCKPCNGSGNNPAHRSGQGERKELH